MGLLDKAKAAAGQAAVKAKLAQAYAELGKTAFSLVESGAISHPQLETGAAKIRTLKEQDGEAEKAATAESSEPPTPT